MAIKRDIFARLDEDTALRLNKLSEENDIAKSVLVRVLIKIALNHVDNGEPLFNRS